jgi:two-component system, chemotaxis family, CheB/CheR fusion protein
MPSSNSPPQVLSPTDQLRRSKEASRFGDVPLVAIGASAGGLQACISLLAAVTENSGLGYVIIQHLSPDHESLMAELLGANTPMKVYQIEQGMKIEPNCVYVNPPGQDVSLSGNTLSIRLHSKGGSHQPFDYFLTSLARERRGGAMCVILSGTGHDGSIGIKSIRHEGGFVVAQEPDEAASDGMPRSAILTGDVDAVLKTEQIPPALTSWYGLSAVFSTATAFKREAVPEWLHQVLQIVLEKTGSDFTLYKPGTLVRRITRRMLSTLANADAGEDYVKLLISSQPECEALAADLFINVTRFFRDADVFERLENSIIPELVRAHDPVRPLRVWVAGCSSGEEAWSLAMLFHEAIHADGRGIRLQLLASDIDADAIATARAGIYSAVIAADISPDRLARFFVAEDGGYLVGDELKSQCVFAVHNLLSDPPFARLDMVSCRNVLIYLGNEAQTKIISLFHFALVPQGVLLLGTSETAGDIAGRFDDISRAERIYRRFGQSTSSNQIADTEPFRPDVGTPVFLTENDRNTDHRYMSICVRAIARHYTPASVLVTRQGVCLYFLGPVEDYLGIVAGSASLEILPMVPRSHRARLRNAIAEVGPERPSIQLDGVKTLQGTRADSFQTHVHFIADEFDDVILITFQVAGSTAARKSKDTAQQSIPADAALGRVEITGLRDELDHTLGLLQRSLETERVMRSEALRLNEEYQSTNEELVTSKEELQSLNEELTVLNNQLQEALDRQRITSDDLKNVLNSTNVATIFLDEILQIRFFTPATTAVFGVIAADIGRPLADLRPLTLDPDLISDAAAVLKSAEPVVREVTTRDGVWFRRRIVPYFSTTAFAKGVVITYVDILEQHKATEVLNSAIRKAENAIISKTRFLASASHDLRQPLQTLTFIQSLMALDAHSNEQQQLIHRMEQAVSAMSGMLNTMLDINQIEAGIVNYDIQAVAVSDVLTGLFTEYAYHAEAKSIKLRLVHSSALIETDIRLLQQMLRNLISNAIRYTDSGRILIGCKRKGDRLRVEIWDTGIGIAENELSRVFGEYQKITIKGREASDGVGLGLSIVQRLADLLGHRIYVRSEPGRGSMFAIEIPLTKRADVISAATPRVALASSETTSSLRTGTVLIAEDDPDLRDLLQILLAKSGHIVLVAADIEAALAAAALSDPKPELLIADYNLPMGQTGLELSRRLKQTGIEGLEVIILTGDISARTQELIAEEGFAQLKKPVSPSELETAIQSALLHRATAANLSPLPDAANKPNGPDVQVVIIDDDQNFTEMVVASLASEGLRSVAFSSGEAFLAEMKLFAHTVEPVCILIDAYLGGISGFDVLSALQDAGSTAAAIMITGRSDVQLAVRAMKCGAIDFIEKPVDVQGLSRAIDDALRTGRNVAAVRTRRIEAQERLAKLTTREREILARVLAGDPNKNIAADLGISQRTVESHRASVMTKTGCKTLPALVRLAVRAS